jgi:glucokinase
VALAVGIDVGGTKIAGGLVDLITGSVVRREDVPTAPERGPDAVLADCRRIAEQLASPQPVRAVGIGVCETVDPSGRVTSAETIDWRGTDVAAALDDLAPAVVESDVRAAAVAEVRHGAGRGYREVLVVVVGTGISHCLVVDGHPYRGARGNAIVTGAPPVERRSSGLALARAGGRARAEEVVADPAQAALVEEAAAALGGALAMLVNALDPAALVIAGGLGLNDGYRAKVEQALRPAVWSATTAALPVLPASLGADAGLVGAALVAAGDL